MSPELISLIEKLFSLDALKLALLVLLCGAAGTAFTKYIKVKQAERRAIKREELSHRGANLVSMLEEQMAPFPRHWSTYVDQRIEHKVSNMMAVPISDIRRVDRRVEELQKETKEQTRKIDRIIGRMFPEEPID